MVVTAHAQMNAADILLLPRDQQMRALWNYRNDQRITDTMAMVNHLRQLEKDFEAAGESKLAQQAWLAQIDYQSVYLHYYKPYGIYILDQAIDYARERGWKQLEAECMLRKGFLLYRQNKFGPAFEFIQKGYSGIKKGGFNNTPLIIRYLEDIGLCYYEFGDPEGGITYLREALAQPSRIDPDGEKRKTYNTIGVCFNRLEQLDSAYHYFALAHETATAVQDTFWAALSLGNMGNILFLQEKYDQAIPFLEKDFYTSQKYGEWPSAVNASLSLATMHLKRGDIDKAQFYLDYASKNKNMESARSMSGYYKNMASIRRLQGDDDQAFQYLDSFLLYKEKDEKERNIKTINQAKLKVEVEHHANEIKLLETARSRQVLMRNGLLFILLLTGGFTLVYVRMQRQRQVKERQLMNMREEAARTELEHAKKQLSAFTHALKEKNELIESFRDELDQLHQSGQEHALARSEHITKLLNSTILTEEDWREFRTMFDLVHPGFFVRLKEKMNDLTPAETRLLALTKLQLAPREMAAMLGISYDAIKKSRQRLRKKIHLPEEGTLDELVELI
jgi:tetratricopeptide (TPR) repeat protein